MIFFLLELSLDWGHLKLESCESQRQNGQRNRSDGLTVAE